MKRISSFIFFVATGISLLSFTIPVYAAPAAPKNICPTNQFASLCQLKLSEGGLIVGRVVTILLVFAILIALIFLIWGGIRWIMSSGDKSKLEGARGTVIGATVGLIIALSAYFFLNVITYLFTNTTITDLSIPTIVP